MIRITAIAHAAGAKSYFRESLVRGDYYGERDSVQGRWGGLAADRLGLSGSVEQESFFRLIDNRHPVTNEKITVRDQAHRRVGWDMTLSAKKSLSVLYALTRDEELRSAFEQSVDETMQLMEQDTRVRVRKGKANDSKSERVSGNLCWAAFTHEETRPLADGVPDCHMHTHVVVMNLSFDFEENRFKAADIATIKRDGEYYEAVFDSILAKKLVDQGYPVVRTGPKSWELAGLDNRHLLAKFSRRTQQINEVAERRGITDPVEKAELGARTRQSKTESHSPADLRRLWWNRLADDEKRAVTAVARQEVAATEPNISASQAMDESLLHAFERKSVVTERELMAHALRRGVGAVTRQEVERETQRPEILTRELDGRRWSTTAEVLAEESRMIERARGGRGAAAPLGQGATVQRDWLSEEQKRAVESVWRSHDTVQIVRGRAGVGKTTLMTECIEGIEAQGTRVVTLAPSAEASRGVLRREGFQDADTVARFLLDPSLQQKARGGVLWVDESGLLGSRDMARLLEVAHENESRLILSGDVRQLKPVGRGDALRVLEEQAGLVPAEIKEIRRQQGEYREAVRQLSSGTNEGIERGFHRLSSLGAIHEIPDASDRQEQVVQHYLDAKRRGQTSLVIAPTHREGDDIALRVRRRLQAEELLASDDQILTRYRPLPLTEGERRDPIHYGPGTIVQFHQSARGGFARGRAYEVVGHSDEGDVWVREVGSKKTGETNEAHRLPLDQTERLSAFRAEPMHVASGEELRITHNAKTTDGRHRLNNGQVVRIASIADDHVELDNGWKVPKDFGHWAYATTTTVHAAQGRTVDHVILSAPTGTWPAVSRESFYVAVSRGRRDVTIVTDDAEGLREAVARTGERTSATELVHQAEQEKTARRSIAERQKQDEHERDSATLWPNRERENHDGREVI